jgi:hypothetical protein
MVDMKLREALWEDLVEMEATLRHQEMALRLHHKSFYSS